MKHQLPSLSVAFLALGVASGCASAGGAATGAPAASAITPEMVAQGQALFAAGSCARCHGPTGQGGRSGPSLADDTWLWVDPAGDVQAQLVTVIRDGVPQPREARSGMPAMGGGNYTEEQLQALAAYIQSL